ncbi:hypothetical protein MTR67_016134 [Solanum verrucosum]|uniref:Bet v I/Major latex protein domain-containing protein n=1 Tax=Solanum verrucosum TaxID=315347 RepID=A0AAF0TKP9_SOLVR|nr:hypothetical protein MTR67_016134 [Solanum verrucosum]
MKDHPALALQIPWPTRLGPDGASAGGNEILFKDVVESVDLEKKSITWKVIGGNMLELYNSFTIITSSEHQWTTITLLYEKKTEDTPEPLTHLGVLLNGLKDIESHLLKK